MAAYDIVIRNGQVADGTGKKLFAADVALKGDRIAAVEAPGIEVVYSAQMKRLGYWDTANTLGLHFTFGPEPVLNAFFNQTAPDTMKNNYAGYGFSYVFKKSMWDTAPFPHVKYASDFGFVAAAALTAGGLAQVAWLAWRVARVAGPRGFGLSLGLMILIQFSLGLSNVWFSLPIGVAVAHTGLGERRHLIEEPAGGDAERHPERGARPLAEAQARMIRDVPKIDYAQRAGDVIAPLSLPVQ